MSDLKNTIVRTKIKFLCDYFFQITNAFDLNYIDCSRETFLDELTQIQKQNENSEALTIAFVGEYSSGKTSMINLLTNNQFSVGTDVVTAKSRKIIWNNFVIIDTPGLGSGDTSHDEETKNWLLSADFLVYVITPDLYNSSSGERFCTLLDDFKREHDIMLVMNMIDKEDNDLEIFAEELQNVLGHRELESYSPTYISAEYEELSRSTDFSQEDREWYKTEGNFQSFIDKLNEFILNKKERAQLSTPLIRLIQLSKQIGFRSEYDKEIALLDLKIGLFSEKNNELQQLKINTKLEVEGHADKTVGEILSCIDDPPKDFEGFCKEQFENFASSVEKSIHACIKELEQILEDIGREQERIDASKLSQEVKNNIQKSDLLKDIMEIDFSKKNEDPKSNQLLEQVRKQVNNLSGEHEIEGMTQELLKSNNIRDLTTGILKKLGTRENVLKIGHFLGHKFRPWEAVKLSKNIAKAIPIINVAGAIFDAVMHYRKQKKKEEHKQKIAEFRKDIRSTLNDASDNINRDINDMIASFEGLITSLRDLVQHKKEKLQYHVTTNRENMNVLEEKKELCFKLYDDIYS